MDAQKTNGYQNAWLEKNQTKLAVLKTIRFDTPLGFADQLLL